MFTTATTEFDLSISPDLIYLVYLDTIFTIPHNVHLQGSKKTPLLKTNPPLARRPAPPTRPVSKRPEHETRTGLWGSAADIYSYDEFGNPRYWYGEGKGESRRSEG